MSATISEPFLLSGYAVSQRPTKSKSTGPTLRTPANVYATHEKASGSSDGIVTVAVQGDGVHILDVSALHPVISHTLGPSTTFSCPAVTRNTRSGGTNTCTTYAVVESSPDISAEDERGRTVWMWSEDLSSSLLDRTPQRKTSVVVPHVVSRVYVTEDLPERVVLLSPQGDITITDTDLKIQSTQGPSNDGCLLLASYLFPRISCPFVSGTSASPRGSIIVLLEGKGDSTLLRCLGVSEEEGLVQLGGSQVPLKPNQISSISCSPSGYLSILARDATWRSFQLQSHNGTSIDVSPVSEPLHLTSLSFISPQNKTDPSSEISLLSLGSSHVLLAGLTNAPTQELALLLWDLQYSVLLASHTFPVPSTHTQSKETTLSLDLVPAGAFQALLVLSSHPRSPPQNTKQPAGSRTSVLVVPCAAPAVSTIANAMGRAAAGAKWLAQDRGAGAAAPAQITPAQAKLLDTMRTAVEQNRPQAANGAFLQWEKDESADILLESGKTKGKGKIDAGPVLSHGFVKQVLEIVLQPSRPANAAYSSEILWYLLNKQVVSANMVEGGLLAVLRLRNDWKSIELALSSVLDIQETEIISALQHIVIHHRKKPVDPTAMQVDSTPTDLPSLEAFLPLCVNYSTSPPALRVAFRHHLREAEDVLSVLNVLESWIARWNISETTSIPFNKKAVSKNDRGVYVCKPIVDIQKPPPIKVLSFLQTLLDASFLTLLNHPPSHKTLQKLMLMVEPQVSLIDQLGQLRGPLEPFVKAQAKALKEGSGEGRKEPLVDWRQRRKQVHEQAGLAIGLYRLEELVL